MTAFDDLVGEGGSSATVVVTTLNEDKGLGEWRDLVVWIER